MQPLFVLTIFIGAALLFLVQPMAARGILPVLGGGPAVWTTCMLFFQGALLLGYVYAHLLGGLKRPWAQLAIHAAVLMGAVAGAALVEPARAAPAPQAWPVPWVLATLAITAGPGFFALASAGPLLQRWFAGVGHARSERPYFLYAASNAGSFIGLLAYPFVLERVLSLGEQRRAWVAGLGCFAVLMLGCGLARARSRAPDAAAPTPGGPPMTWRQRGTWAFLAFIPSSLMIGVTSYLSSDIAAFPLLWVIPLAIYLLSFTMAFGRSGPVLLRVLDRIGPFVLIVTALAFVGGRIGFELPPMGMIAFHLAGFALIATWVHARLAASAPAATNLTEFYLVISIGGVAGGVFNAIVAPAIFVLPVEYPLVLALVGLVLPWRSASLWPGRSGRLALLVLPAVLLIAQVWLIRWLEQADAWPDAARSALLLVVPVTLALAAKRHGLAFAVTLAAGVLAGTVNTLTSPKLIAIDRSFFGVMRVEATPEGEHAMHEFLHGTTIHGKQVVSPEIELRRMPLAYYYPSGPFGDAMRAAADRAGDGAIRTGVIGLGTGGVATYTRPGDTMTFYEIDPAVERIARNTALFTYLHDAPGEIEVLIGDGRRLLAEAGPEVEYDVFFLDAFSSDSIPVHLLTREAFELYFARLADDGLIVAHVSNRYMDLVPVVADIAASLDAPALIRDYMPSEEDAELSAVSTTMVVIGRPGAARPEMPDTWIDLRGDPSGAVWTDDHADVVSAIYWSR